MDMDDDEQQQAAIRLQALHRGMRARQKTRQRRQLKQTERAEREKMATRLQALSRGKRERQLAGERRERVAAATAIQTKIRAKQATRGGGGEALSGPGHFEKHSIALNGADIKKGLHTVGRNPHTLTHCYTGLTLKDTHIGSIAAIADYPLLQSVDLSGNCISDLRPLARLPFLLEFKASSNCVKELPDLSLVRDEDYSWRASEAVLQDWRSELVHSVSMLHNLELDCNEIEVIRPMHEHRYLQRLVLSHNNIGKIEGLEGLHSLTDLDLSFNRISAIGTALSGLGITELNLEHNAICEVEGVDSNHLPHLATLMLGHNKITTLGGAKGCLQLRALHLENNSITHIRQVEWLTESTALSCLVLEGCPVIGEELYRLRVIARLLTLRLLDRTSVSAMEKVRALNLQGGADSDLPNRIKTHMEAFRGPRGAGVCEGEEMAVDGEGECLNEPFYHDMLPKYEEPEPEPIF